MLRQQHSRNTKVTGSSLLVSGHLLCCGVFLEHDTSQALSNILAEIAWKCVQAYSPDWSPEAQAGLWRRARGRGGLERPPSSSNFCFSMTIFKAHPGNSYSFTLYLIIPSKYWTIAPFSCIIQTIKAKEEDAVKNLRMCQMRMRAFLCDAVFRM